MTRQRILFYVASAALVIAALALALRPQPARPLRASLVAAAAPAAGSRAGFSRAEAPRAFSFPADHGPHDDFQTEWWYFTGNLATESGERFGFQLTFFRRALVPPDLRTERASAWAADQVYMAHFAVTDVAEGRHRSFQKLARGAAGLAGAQAAPFRVWLEDWSVAEVEAGERVSWRVRAATSEAAIDLALADLKGPVLQGDRGYSRKGPEPGNASYYYSLSRLAVEGVIRVSGRDFRVSGLSWMDHEFSTSALGPEQVGWDWFSIQLDDGSELMVFQLRRADGSSDGFSSGTLIGPDGSATRLGPDDFSLEVTSRWRSPRSGGNYPAGWVLTAPSLDLELTLTPHLADQELDVSYIYWEGAVSAAGNAQGRAVTGHGYVELTGYAGSFQGQF